MEFTNKLTTTTVTAQRKLFREERESHVNTEVRLKNDKLLKRK